MKRVCFFLLVMLMLPTAICLAQGAAKCFDYAAMYEGKKDYANALYWYHTGCLKGSLKNYTFGTAAYFRLTPLILTGKYDSADREDEFADKYKLFIKAGDFIAAQRSLWPSEADKRRIAPDWDVYDRILTDMTEALLTRGEQGNTRESLQDAFETVTVIMESQRKVFEFEEERNKIAIDAERNKDYAAKIDQFACRDVQQQIAEAQALYAQRSYRDAYRKAVEASEAVTTYNCPDEKAKNIMEQALSNGRVAIAVFPLKGQDNIRDLDDDIIDAIKSLQDPFVAGIETKDLENMLLHKDISLEDTYSADIVSLSKLGKVIGFQSLITGTIVQADPGYGSLSTKNFTAYMVESDNDGKYAHKPVSFSEHTGKKVSRYKAAVKITDIRTKAVIFNEVIEFSYTDELHYVKTPVAFSNLSQREFDNFRDKTGSVGSTLVSALGASIAPADVQQWRPQWQELEDARTDFIAENQLTREFAMKICLKVRDVVSNSYGTP